MENARSKVTISVMCLVFRGLGFMMSCPSSSVQVAGSSSHDSWIRIGRSTNWPPKMFWTSFGGMEINPRPTVKGAVIEVRIG